MKASELSKALATVSGSVATIEFIPILTHVLLRSDVGQLCAWNGVTAITYPLESELTLGLRGDVFRNIVDTFPPGKEVQIEKTPKGNEVTVRCGRSRVNLAYLPVSEFEDSDSAFKLPKEKVKGELEVTEELIKAFTLCLETIGLDAMQKEFSGVTVKVENSQVVCYSSNFVALTKATVPMKKEQEETATLLLPKSFVEQLCTLTKELKEFPTLSYTKAWIWVKFSMGIHLYSRLLGETPPKFEDTLKAHMPKNQNTWFELPKGIQETFKRCLVVLGRDPQKRATVSVSEDLLRIKAKGEFGEVDDQLKLKRELDQVVLQVSIEIILPVLDTAEEMVVSKTCVLLRGEQYLRVISVVGA